MVKPFKTTLVVLLTLAGAVSFHRDFLFFLLGFEILVLIFAWVQCRYISRHTSLIAEVPQRIVRQGEEFILHGKLQNKGWFPISQLTARLAVQWFPERESLLMVGKLPLSSREEGKLCFTLHPEHIGCMDVRPDKLVVTDSLGLMQRRCPVDSTQVQPVYILPRISGEEEAPPGADASFFREDGDITRQGQAEPDITEIRNYLPGDPMKLAHWKLFARTGELMIREMSEPAEKLAWLYLNLGETEGAPVRSNPDAWDHFITTVAQISAGLLRWGQPHAVVWLDCLSGEFSQHRVTTGEDLQSVLCSLLRASTYPARDLSQLLREYASDETKGTCIEIDLQGHFVRSETAG